MGSNFGARILLTVGFIAAFIGYDAWIVSHVALDPNTTRAAAHALLATPSVRHGLADAITKQIEQQVPAAANDKQLDAAVATAVRDPRVATAFADTIANIHRTILASESTRTFVVDGRALTASVHDALARSNPRLAAQLERVAPLDVRVKTDKLPRVHDPRSTADGITLLAVIAALLLITASLLLQHDRRSIARVGRRIAFLAITPIVALVVLPRVLAHASGDAPQIASALLRVYGDRVLPSAVGLVIAGVLVVVGALAWPRRDLASSESRAVRGVTPYTGPEPSPRPRVSPDQPTSTEKMYL
jgi:hypothetical protein